MKSIDKEKLFSIVKRLMIEPSEQVIDQILLEWEQIQQQMKIMNKIDTSNIEPLTHINETPLIDFLREDVEDNSFSISKQQILENAPEKDDNYIITTRVVK
ncbi:glutamyl-tRNA(gln)amidotransferase subunit C [Mycoplasmopsis bovigenitalium]|uniref:Glutamyl-tRNA(Gln)amidotransferase subunit C n=1 Tax=Mycoplasmopsis bovigenitalium TaxID=2112 RepID=A0A1L7MYT2_9BACT|nr:Asp-tRNA(Asn)/Glu-tRNA(Gln) amidotransferase subunit GatC [Mycoplasmopsis bovigenitalium]BAW18402.1 glutamyl-tRNA(Gln) amidotransferase subunit C [Mycoplasmopsis bovigenitalium]VEU61102.1 glutamyl-tRNA(gln)amidotransferase subunit C [Mycoplasmopsis bovigenitalium]